MPVKGGRNSVLAHFIHVYNAGESVSETEKGVKPFIRVELHVRVAT